MKITTPSGFLSVLSRASAEGNEAFRKAAPEPMTVTDGVRSWHVEDGVCGSAWVRIAGNTAFGRYCKRNGIARPAYGGGLSIYPSIPSQSLDRNTAWATAFADELQRAGIDAQPHSRID